MIERQDFETVIDELKGKTINLITMEHKENYLCQLQFRFQDNSNLVILEYENIDADEYWSKIFLSETVQTNPAKENL